MRTLCRKNSTTILKSGSDLAEHCSSDTDATRGAWWSS